MHLPCIWGLNDHALANSLCGPAIELLITKYFTEYGNFLYKMSFAALL